MRILPQELMWKPKNGKGYGGYFNTLKQKGGELVIGQILNLIGSPSKKNLIALTKVLEMIAGSEGSVNHVKRLRWLFESEHPHLLWWQKIISELDPNVRNRWIMDFYVSGYYSDNQRKRFSFQEKHGFYPPTVLLMSVTQKCNFSCTGCWAHNYDVKEDLSFEQWKKVIKEARDEIGIHIIPVVGGEPFARADFLDIAAEFPDCAFITFTNGSLLTDETIEKIRKLGNVYPMLSLSGWEESTDKIRGNGTFNMIMEKMDKLKKAGILFGASLTSTRHNAEEISSDEFYQMLSKKGVLWTWVFHYVPIGENPDASLMPTPEQREMIRLAAYNARNTLPMFTVDFWGDGPEVMGCIAGGRQYIHVNAKGDVEPCAFVHLATHNIKNCTLTDALKSPFMSEIRKNIPYDGNHLRICMIVDRPDVLREYYNKFKPYETHKGAADYLTKPEIIEKIDKYSKEAKTVLDKSWAQELFMTAFPLEGEYYHDPKVLCSKEIPHDGKHGGCKKNGGCNCLNKSDLALSKK